MVFNKNINSDVIIPTTIFRRIILNLAKFQLMDLASYTKFNENFKHSSKVKKAMSTIPRVSQKWP